MRALAKRHTRIESSLEQSSDYCFNQLGLDAVIVFRKHALKRQKHRHILHANVVYMVEKGFETIIGLKNKTEFVLVNSELNMSVVGCVSCTGYDIVISVITVIDSDTPRRKDTLLIAV